MASTAGNMLKVIHDRKCGVIIMLSDLVENGMVYTCREKINADFTGTFVYLGEQLSILASS